jgi:hypothetical protein
VSLMSEHDLESVGGAGRSVLPQGGCPDSDSSMDDCGASHLAALQDILSGRGLKCELNDRGTWPRLRIYGPCDTDSAVAEFDNNIVVVPRGEDWWFAWPWSETITPVGDVLTAAGRIIGELGWAAL